jgi:hypothetical protein
MNALIQERHEAPVMAEEAIERNLEALRKESAEGKSELRADNKALREIVSETRTDVRELRADNKTLRDRIEAVHTTLRTVGKALHWVQRIE